MSCCHSTYQFPGKQVGAYCDQFATPCPAPTGYARTLPPVNISLLILVLTSFHATACYPWTCQWPVFVAWYSWTSCIRTNPALVIVFSSNLKNSMHAEAQKKKASNCTPNEESRSIYRDGYQPKTHEWFSLSQINLTFYWFLRRAFCKCVFSSEFGWTNSPLFATPDLRCALSGRASSSASIICSRTTVPGLAPR